VTSISVLLLQQLST